MVARDIPKSLMISVREWPLSTACNTRSLKSTEYAFTASLLFDACLLFLFLLSFSHMAQTFWLPL
jgi:hypothetical protein